MRGASEESCASNECQSPLNPSSTKPGLSPLAMDEPPPTSSPSFSAMEPSPAVPNIFIISASVGQGAITNSFKVTPEKRYSLSQRKPSSRDRKRGRFSVLGHLHTKGRADCQSHL
ncbi:hypothetical protein PoB_002663400 [Plakobranchus ocellatus]|uniref:Uncharacterized protein n=1 Tax=Plakobranchus ocellatus TaxID=259542 RepID=A0AAV4A0K5_9GAST|nr:hypothetical protein PoB_002663400 [Plakobranchus ocellatus]